MEPAGEYIVVVLTASTYIFSKCNFCDYLPAEWQQNGNTAVKTKAESSSESLPAAPYSPACQSSPPLKPHPPFRPRPPNRPSLNNDSPAHQPVLPIQPSPPIQSHKPKTSRPTRLRKAFSLKTQSTLSHSSGSDHFYITFEMWI